MSREIKGTRSLLVLSWAVPIAAIVTVLFLLAAIGWFWKQTVLTTEFAMPPFQGMSLGACYMRIVSAGFVNLEWGLAFVGLAFMWVVVRRKGSAYKRIAIGISLMLVHRFLLLTFVFLVLFGKYKT